MITLKVLAYILIFAVLGSIFYNIWQEIKDKHNED